MPYYDFYCEDCGEEFEEYYGIEEERLNLCCPYCGGKNISRDFSSVSLGIRGGKRKSKDDEDSSCGFTSFG